MSSTPSSPRPSEQVGPGRIFTCGNTSCVWGLFFLLLVCLCDIRTSSVSHRGIVVTTASKKKIKNKKTEKNEGMNQDEGSGGLNTDGRRFGQ